MSFSLVWWFMLVICEIIQQSIFLTMKLRLRYMFSKTDVSGHFVKYYDELQQDRNSFFSFYWLAKTNS